MKMLMTNWKITLAILVMLALLCGLQGVSSAADPPAEDDLKIVIVVNYPSPPIGYTVSKDLIMLEDSIRFVVGIASLQVGRGRCIGINSRINGVQYTIHNSKWMRRDNAMGPWSDVPDTENDSLCFKYSPTSAGEYILVVEISIDEVRKKYASATLLRVTGDLPSTSTMATTEPADDDTILIPDPNLAAAIREEIGNSITKQTLLNLTRLEAPNRGITDLTGLAHAHNLTYLNLGDVYSEAEQKWFNSNRISDLSPLAGLTQLTHLYLNDPNDRIISDITPLTNLTQLSTLYLAHNIISDITPLTNLTQLTELSLGNNSISDIRPLAGLTQLVQLWIWNNSISDIRPLAELTRLNYLDLRSNSISDIRPLAGLTQLVQLWIWGNRLSDASIKTHIRAMQAKGIVVEFEVYSVLTQGTGEKIGGPWLWVIAPTGNSGAGAALSGRDFLSEISDGSVTELAVATNGATAGTPVGDSVWTPHTLSATRSDNINDMVNTAGLGSGNIDTHVAYGSIALDAPKEQQTQMFAGSDDAVKVWLNGELVHNNPVDRGAPGFQDQFPVTLKKGTNILLVAVYEGWGAWSGFFGFAADAEYTLILPTDSTVKVSPASVASPAVGEQLEMRINITDGEAVAGYQVAVQFDMTALRYVSSVNGDYLPAGAFFIRPSVAGNLVRFGAVAVDGESDGDGTLARLTFEVIAVKASTLKLSGVILVNSAAEGSRPRVEDGRITVPAVNADVNGDGTVDNTDVMLVALALGTDNAKYDVNGDGTVDFRDAVLVLENRDDNAAGAPTIVGLQLTDVQIDRIEEQIDLLIDTGDRSPAALRALVYLQQLLATVRPEQTQLLANYPNPFNPETWIPYQLAKSADVTLRIYAVDGVLVRTLALGHQMAGYYTGRDRAAYWDGRNALGEKVASGLYFYTITAGDFTATRKMLIRK